MKYFLFTIFFAIAFNGLAQTPASEDTLKKDKVVSYAEVMPKFPGGNDSLGNFINNNLIYPKNAVYRNISGTVKISFVVDTTGDVTNVKVVKSVNKELDAEALRLVSAFPKFTPGYQNGRKVKVVCLLPIEFVLE